MCLCAEIDFLFPECSPLRTFYAQLLGWGRVQKISQVARSHKKIVAFLLRSSTVLLKTDRQTTMVALSGTHTPQSRRQS